MTLRKKIKQNGNYIVEIEDESRMGTTLLKLKMKAEIKGCN